MNDQISRILNSKLCDSIAQTVIKNNEELQELESVLDRRNQEVVSMQRRISEEMMFFQRVIEKNQGVREQAHRLKHEVCALTVDWKECKMTVRDSIQRIGEEMIILVQEQISKFFEAINQQSTESHPERMLPTRVSRLQTAVAEYDYDNIHQYKHMTRNQADYQQQGQEPPTQTDGPTSVNTFESESQIAFLQNRVSDLELKLAAKQAELQSQKQKNNLLAKRNSDKVKEHFSKIFKRKDSDSEKPSIVVNNQNILPDSGVVSRIALEQSRSQTKHSHKNSVPRNNSVKRGTEYVHTQIQESANKSNGTSGSNIKTSSRKTWISNSGYQQFCQNSASPLRPLDTNISLSDFPRKQSMVVLTSCPSQAAFQSVKACFDFSLIQREYRFEGKRVNGRKLGRGRAVYESGYKYEGYFVGDMREGRGTLTNSLGIEVYTGEWSQGVFHGKGRLYEFNQCLMQSGRNYKNWKCYTGHFNKGAMEGYGSITFSNDQKFLCSFKNGSLVGQGVYYKQDQVLFGQLRNGKLANPVQ